MRIYTKTGDGGETGLFGGRRVAKDDLRVEAYGTVDELNALLGAARAHQPEPELDALLFQIQNDLFTLGGDLATPTPRDENRGRIHIVRTSPAQTEQLEQAIDRYEAELPPLTNFILPGGSKLACALHTARTVCRRAERRSVTLAVQEKGNEDAPNPEALRYLNRLSDLLFVLARVANQQAGVADVVWQSPRS